MTVDYHAQVDATLELILPQLRDFSSAAVTVACLMIAAATLNRAVQDNPATVPAEVAALLKLIRIVIGELATAAATRARHES